MRPTARAEALREPLREALETLSRAVAPELAFDPATAHHTWRIAASDYSESTVVLPMLNALRAAAPHTRLAVVEIAPSLLARQAEQGHIDLAFHTTENAPMGLRQRALFTERYVLAGRADHPRLKRRPTLAQFCALEHAIVSPSGGGFQAATDAALARVGMSRRVVLSVPHFLVLVALLEKTDLVAMVPARLVHASKTLRVVAPPIEIPGYEMSMLWHERVHRDPAHRWLREFIAHAV
jgi:DNA-binding transcriptional LysR family regulator